MIRGTVRLHGVFGLALVGVLVLLLCMPCRPATGPAAGNSLTYAEKALAALVIRHFEARAADDLPAYLDTLDFADKAAGKRAGIGYEAIWQQVDLLQPEVVVLASEMDAEQERGVVVFTVAYLLRVRDSGRTYHRRETDAAIVVRRGNRWRISRIGPLDTFRFTPQALSGEDLAVWREEAEVVRHVLDSLSIPDRRPEPAGPDSGSYAGNSLPVLGADLGSDEPTVQVQAGQALGVSRIPEAGLVSLALFPQRGLAGTAPFTGPVRDPGEEIFVVLTYSGFAPGDVLNCVWLNRAGNRRLFTVPLVLDRDEGEIEFVLPRPLIGWTEGAYRLVIEAGEDVLHELDFSITGGRKP